MITSSALQYLAAQRRRDAEVLLKQKRNAAAVYLMGYALEFSFKRKIANTLGFGIGFPETAADFGIYSVQRAAFNAISTGVVLSQLRQIKNHDLNQLIVFSGAETRIKSLFLSDWLIIQSWNPEDRYRLRRY